MPDRSTRRPRDSNQLAKLVVDIATGGSSDNQSTSRDREKNPAAVALGKLGGRKGGKSRAERLTPEERSEIAARAARARWGKRRG